MDEWRGVPYAAPPLAALRWRPPAAVAPWSGIRPATAFAPECVQLSSDTSVDGSEDCLYLNVSAPAGSASAGRLPVMVHLHGGSNWFSHPYQHASALVQHGVIVVTVAYRLGMFGFVGHPALSAEGAGSSGEYGVLDQIAALHWVQDNITAFGGDPRNVTLFGESAGSFDAVAIAASPLGHGLFARLAAQTESFWAGRGTGRIADAEENGLRVSAAVGCSTAPDAARCLRSLPAATLVLAAGPDDVAPWVGGVVLPASPLELIAAQSDPVPMLLGSNREEAVFFLLPGIYPGDPYPKAEWVRDSSFVGPQNSVRARKLYPLSDFDSAYWSTIGMFTDAVYTCPMRRLALATSGPVYRYLYTHRYQNDPFLASFRAAHFWDDPVLWHDGTLLGGYQFSPDEDALAARMAGYWTNFAKTGDPNGPGLPVWPRFTAATERTTVLDQPAGQVSRYQVTECAFFDALPDLFAPARAYTPIRRWPPDPARRV